MKDQAASIIIKNNKGEILLQLRDNKPTIKYPNCWCNLGGKIEDKESPEEGIKREVKEEIGITLEEFKLFKKYELPDRTDWVFYTFLNLNPQEINLAEGQEIKYFSYDETKQLRFGFGEEIFVKDFFLQDRLSDPTPKF